MISNNDILISKYIFLIYYILSLISDCKLYLLYETVLIVFRCYIMAPIPATCKNSKFNGNLLAKIKH